MYGLEQGDIDKINSVFSKYPEVEKAILYGSRAKGNYKPHSDIDITLVGKTLKLSQQFSIETDLDDLLLPYKMDLSIFHKIENKDLIEHINRVGINLYNSSDNLEKLENENEWDEVIIGDYIDLISGYAFKSKDFLENQVENSLSVLKIKNVANGDVHLNGVQYHLYNDKLEKFLITKNDTLIAMTGNHPQAKSQVVGDVSRYRLNTNSLLNQRVGKIVCSENIDEDFTYYFFKDDTTHKYLANQSSGSANQANISKTNILNLAVNLPSLPEQKAIANVLSGLDNKIDLLYRQNKTLEGLSKALFRQWLVEEVNEEWEEESLSSIATFLNGLACQKFPPKNEIDKLPVLKIKDLKSGLSESSDFASTDVNEKYLVQNGDVIFSWSASLVVKIWDGEDCILNQHLFKVTSERFPKWFYYLWSKYHLDMFIAIAKAHATTMGHIKRGDLDDAMVVIPPPAELAKMSKTFTPLIDKIIANNKQIKQVEKLRDTLLPKLMSGEIRVQI
ncbi:type I restriction enzyme S subunit [Maribacter caenipelagi]|uniref:Type I restriction enzyme S subunit n=1 Tax=Maribacter caenipelagi TaxID=1447781 RepID=A0A4R7DBW1_9FLAO|nr:restriction endonuclease subunit S [Maribacter caenipelagi]TDS18883.1 type I restriction enzyme S subunit [Maribacter caenipelagi]